MPTSFLHDTIAREDIQVFPASFAQQWLWFLGQSEPDSATYNVPVTIGLRGLLDVSALERSLNAIVQRHEALRTTFHMMDGQPVQVIAPTLTVSLPVVDLRDYHEAERDAQALRLVTDVGHKPFNLARGPLVGATLLRLNEEEHVLLLTIHRIVFDGWSLGVLLRELTTLYEAFSTGQLSPLPELPIQYADFAVWQREMLQGERLAECLAYWKQQLAGMPEGLDLPTDRPHLPVPTSRGSTYRLTLPKWLSDALKELSRREGVSLYMTLVAAFQTLLYRYTGQDDLVIGTVAAGRTQVETEGLIGFFVNILALRTDLSGNPTFGELLGRVREVLLEAQAHQDLPFESLVKELHPTRLLGQNPLFQVMLSFESPLPTLPPAWTLAQLEVETGTTKFDLSLELDDRPEGLISCFEYSTDLFDEATIARMAGHWQTLLEGVAADPAQRIATLPLLTQAERHQELVEWNATGAVYPQDQCIHQLFESQAERTPEAVAVVFENEQLTYRELNRRANQLAHYLCDLGVGPEVLVGICVERSLDMVVGLLGILKAGGAYVPLDPAFPSERLAFMLEDAQAPVLVTQHHLLTTLPAHGAKVICLDADAAVFAQQSEADPFSGATSDHLAYVIYTSGSTGRPKGVQIVHRAVVNFLLSMREQPGLMAKDTLLAITTLSFDIAALELFLPLIVGARLIVASRDTAADGAALAETLTRAHVTVMQATPITWRLLLAAGWQGKPDLKILCGGEALPLELAEQLLPRAASLWNLYGPTETTIWSTICKIEPGEEVVTIGRPIANTQIYLLDPQLQPVPVGVPGELYIGGDGLARGYLHRPELTTERFLPQPFSDEPGACLYRTGDLARYRPDGTIEHLGRLDFQVKLRGFRIELGEIEAVLVQHPAVRQAVVVAREDVPGDKRLVAYVVLCEQQMAKAGDLQRHVIKQLPNYMVPSAVVLLEAFPLTPNGKVDRRALPAPDHSHPERAGSFVAPRAPLEEMVAASWSQVLDIGQVGIHDNFFELGGHSLLAMQVIAHLRITLQVELSLRSFFEAPTIAQLAERIGQLQADTMAPSLLPTIEAISREPYRRPVSLQAVGKDEEGVDEVVVMPSSLVQQGLWLVDQLESDSPTYNLPITLRLRKRLDMSALEQSLQTLVQRHETLRTTVVLIDEQPMQVIAPRMRVPLTAVDLREVPHEQQEVELQRLVSHEVQQSFDLAHGPLLRAAVLHLGAEEHLVLLIMHHIISDGWSVGVIGQELTQLYDAYVTGRPAQLAELPLQYADFALWQREWLQEERLDEQFTYWRETLAGAPPVLELPTDHPRPALPTHRGAEYTFTLAEALSEGLKHLSRQEGVTLYMTLVAGFVALLQRYTEQDDVVIGTTTAGRSQQEIKDVIGYFVNTLVLRIDVGGNPSVREVLARVREGVLGAHAHQEMPFERLVKELQPERSLSQNPIFQVLLTLDPPLPKLASEWEFVQVSTRTVANKFDLALSLSDRDERLAGCLEYSTDLFEDATIVRMMKHWQTLLEAMVADPEQPIAQLPLLTERERQQLLVEWNATQQSAPDKCFPQLFEEQVLRTPDAIALVFEHQQMTYGELNARANQLAYHLQQLGVGPEVMVGLCVERSPEMIVGLLGILKAGGVYVPLDPEYPQERLTFLLQDTQMPVLLTQHRLLSQLPHQHVQLVCLDTDWDKIAQQNEANPTSVVTGKNLAYVIYTSGSTGQPKGVLIPHRALAAHCWSMTQVYELRAEDRILQFSTFTFDASLEQILPTLLVGARLVLRGQEVWSPAQLLEQIKDARLTVINLPPAYLHQVLQEWAQAPQRLLGHHLRLVIVGGDRLLPEALHQWRQMPLRSVRLLNAYGPTEATITATLYDAAGYTGGNTSFESIPIGRPVPNRRVYILDRSGAPVPIGVPGELHIGGDLLARGYLNCPDLTAERFIADPFSTDPQARLYKTGDLARYLADGTIEFLGRVDQQVKIRGFRIELGEIEEVLSRYPEVREAVVAAREDTPGEKYLAAYVVAQQGKALESQALRSYLKQKLPNYMLPAAFISLERLPLLSTGKIDRHALPAPKLAKLTEEDTFVAPRLLIHQQLVQIWEELLDVRPIGIRDNFFYLGGHSLLAARLVDRIEHVFGKRFALSALFSGPTIEQLTEALQQQENSDARASVFPVQVSGSKRPFFFLHGDWTGGAFYCFALGRALGPDQPFYVLEPYKFSGLQSPPSFEAVAAAHIESMRAIQPEGPYLLGGFCNGGLLAYEMARQLQGAGERVDLLALINPTDPVQFETMRTISKPISKLLRLGANKQAHLFLSVRHALRHVYRILYPSSSRVQDFEQLLAIDPRLERMFPPIEALYKDYVGVFTWLVSRYKIGAYPGKITFYWASEEPFIEKTWLPVTEAKDSQDIENHVVPGTHMSCVTEHIQDLAECLSTCVSRIQHGFHC